MSKPEPFTVENLQAILGRPEMPNVYATMPFGSGRCRFVRIADDLVVFEVVEPGYAWDRGAGVRLESVTELRLLLMTIIALADLRGHQCRSKNSGASLASTPH